MQTNTGGLCRLTVVAPRTRMDLALPVEVCLADLLPTLLRHAGEGPDDPASHHAESPQGSRVISPRGESRIVDTSAGTPKSWRGGWVLQRLGENGLDPTRPLADLGIRDGDLLYLRPRDAAIPEFPLTFDDVADAIATVSPTHRAPWQPDDTRRLAFVLAGLCLGVGIAATGAGWAGPVWRAPAFGVLAVGAVTAVLVLLGVPLLPAFAARLARLPIEVIPGPDVVRQVWGADRVLAALIAVSSVLLTGCAVVVVGERSWYAPALVGVLAAAWLLRARHFRGRVQRLGFILGGVALTLVLALRLVGEGSVSVVLTVGVPSLLAAIVLAGWSVAMPDRRLAPYWGRGADLAEVLVLLAVVPLAAGVLGSYGMIAELITNLT